MDRLAGVLNLSYEMQRIHVPITTEVIELVQADISRMLFSSGLATWLQKANVISVIFTAQNNNNNLASAINLSYISLSVATKMQELIRKMNLSCNTAQHPVNKQTTNDLPHLSITHYNATLQCLL